MSEILSLSLMINDKQSHHTGGATAEPQTPGRSGWVEMEEDEKKKRLEEADWDVEHRVSSAAFEPSTLPCRDSKETKNKEEPTKDTGDGGSVESVPIPSGQESRTESERELGPRQKAADDSQMGTKKGGRAVAKRESHVALEASHNDDLGNIMPEEAARVFSPSVTILTEVSKPSEMQGHSRPLWAEDTEKSPFLGPHGTPPDAYYHDWQRTAEPAKCCSRDVLKAVVAVCMAALIFPLLVWGGYTFLPFDAPLLDSTPSRLVYTLRCSVFAVVPIVLGVLVLGASRLRFCLVKPLYESSMATRDVAVHQHYVSDSVSLFLLYFLQLAVLSTYLRQDYLKLVPLLTIVFAFGRLIYWLAGVLGSSIRGVGFGMTFLPILAMLGVNMYFIFTIDAGGSIFAQEAPPSSESPSVPRQRFWG